MTLRLRIQNDWLAKVDRFFRGLLARLLRADRRWQACRARDELKLTERFRLKYKNTLEHRITISDPVTFTKPWDVVLTYVHQPD